MARRTRHLSELVTFKSFLHFVTVVTGVGFFAALWASSFDDGTICPTTRLCASNPFALFLLSVSRFTAGTFYASSAIAFASKLSVVRIQVQNSFLSDFAEFEPHDLHTTFGHVACWSAILHSVAHFVRYCTCDPRKLGNMTSVSGLIALLGIFMILVMAISKWRYELRKAMHYGFLLVLIMLMLHSYNVMVFAAVFLALYVVDWIYLVTFATKLVEEPVFVSIGTGTSVSFRVPEGFRFRPGQYVYVNAPWLSKYEWHAFSLIPTAEFVEGSMIYSDAASFFVEVLGDWTRKLFEEVGKNVRRPIWITPAFPSMADKVIRFDSIVLVCSGIGVTPAISIIERYGERKDIRLVWLCRDLHMISTFAEQVRRVDAHVFYTGEQNAESDRVKDILTTPATKVTTSFWGPDDVRTSVSEVRFVESDGTSLSVRWTYGRPNLDRLVQQIIFLPSGKVPVPGERVVARGMRPSAAMNAAVRALSGGPGGPVEPVEHGEPSNSEGSSDCPIEHVGEHELGKWVVLYCGASKEVHATVKKLCRDMGTSFGHEFFKY